MFFSSLGLLVLSPLFLVIGLAVRKDGGSAFFRQDRVGQNGNIFEIYKFRTMVQNADKLGAQITAGKDARITEIGQFIRKTKIDELPQLLNVFLGHMSLVGPRPEVPKYVAKWEKLNRDVILSVKPGITDYASLVFSNEQELLAESENPEKAYVEEVMPKKLALYCKYVSEMGLWLDFRLIIATLARIFGMNITMLLPELKHIHTSVPADQSTHKATPDMFPR